MSPISIAIGIELGGSDVDSDVLVQNNLEYVEGSNILFVDGSYMLQVE